jgi:hypothetical protein
MRSLPQGLGAALLLVFLPGALPAQTRLEIAFAAGAASHGPPALAWLCGTLLPDRPEWPADLDHGASFVVRLDGDGLAIAPNAVRLPAGAVAVGAIDLGAAQRVLTCCGRDGTEDWFVPAATPLPPRDREILHELRCDQLGRCHTIDCAATIGHRLGASADEPEIDSLQLAAALCGEVTWRVWSTPAQLRVRGRSDGGLLLPALLLALADRRGNGTTDALPLCAYVARDGERGEAVRQLARAEVTDRPALHSMLHGGDELRLCAIDSLVRLGASEELPRIVAAASTDMPLASLAAADAIAALWPSSTATTRQRTRVALAASPIAQLRRLSLAHGDGAAPAAAAGQQQPGLLLLLLVTAIGLGGFWLRARREMRQSG